MGSNTVTSHESVQYFRLGMGYYVAGRYASYSHFIIVAGNLCHHAIEMFLKGKLVPTLGREKLRGNLDRYERSVLGDADVQDMEIRSKDVVFKVYQDGEKFGKLRLSRGAVVWRGRFDQIGRKMSWSRFDTLMQKKAVRAERFARPKFTLASLSALKSRTV